MSEHTITIALRDLKRFRLLVFALSELWLRMKLARDPFAAELEHIVDRATASAEDDCE